MRITTRRSMIAVAVAAVLLYGWRSVAWFFEALGEPYGARRTTTRSWDLGPAPDLTIDNFGGNIDVFPSTDGRVTAVVDAWSFGHDHVADAEADVATIDVACDHRGDTLRISILSTSVPIGGGFRRHAHVELYVLGNVRLDLRTGAGNVRLGWTPKAAGWVAMPIPARSVRVRNDSRGRRVGWGEGDIKVATSAPRAPDGTRIPTRLLLDAPGRIEVDADLAIVEARAWHGTPAEGWTAEQYEAADFYPERGTGEGIIRFVGTLAGASDLRAAHRIELKLGTMPAVRVEAEAVAGSIGGTLLPRPIEPVGKVARWSGSLGNPPLASLRLRADEGPIVLDGGP